MRICLGLLLVLSCYAAALTAAEQEQPSEALLEFLGELEPVDEEIWQILEHHALKDAPGNKEVSNE